MVCGQIHVRPLYPIMSKRTSWIKRFADSLQSWKPGMFISLCYATGSLSLPSHDMLAVWAMQSTFLERSLIHSAKHCCLEEHLNNGVFCSRIFLLCTPLKYDHIPNIATDTGLRHAVFQPKQTRVTVWLSPKIWLQVLKWTKHQLSLYHNLPMLFILVCILFIVFLL